MLDDNGGLTDIGAWYLGNVAVGTTGSSAASAVYASAGWMLLVGVVCLVAAW